MTTEEAYNVLSTGSEHIFLTGNAGTGKSTLIREFIEKHPNECVVLAPTGIAAVNIGGETIHKFFHLPARTVSYSSIKYLDDRNPIDWEKKRIILAAKYLIIDEISMVRADLMDAISWFFKKNFNNETFAHLKVIMIGDINQLPPVIASEEEKEMLSQRYKSEYFFDARCWSEVTFTKIVLTKIWRQSDPVFIKLLGDIKNNCLSDMDLYQLNKTCCTDIELDPSMGIMLCATNKTADMINAEMISMIKGEVVELNGLVKGGFDTKNCTVEPVIHLKIGCQIMTMRNGLGYYNGSRGTFVGRTISGELIIDINGEQIEVPLHEFKSIKYTYDKDRDTIQALETGKFIQYPVKVAYAMTIHKSQGLTFDKIIIDLGERGAFAHGQVYVALSRCTSMQGITLRNPIQKKDLIYNKSVLQFNS